MAPADATPQATLASLNAFAIRVSAGSAAGNHRGRQQQSSPPRSRNMLRSTSGRPRHWPPSGDQRAYAGPLRGRPQPRSGLRPDAPTPPGGDADTHDPFREHNSSRGELRPHANALDVCCHHRRCRHRAGRARRPTRRGSSRGNGLCRRLCGVGCGLARDHRGPPLATGSQHRATRRRFGSEPLLDKAIGMSAIRVAVNGCLTQSSSVRIDPEAVTAMGEAGFAPEGTLDDLRGRADIVCRHFPMREDAVNKARYDAHGLRSVFQGGARPMNSPSSFVAQANYAQACGRAQHECCRATRPVSCGCSGRSAAEVGSNRPWRCFCGAPPTWEVGVWADTVPSTTARWF